MTNWVNPLTIVLVGVMLCSLSSCNRENTVEKVETITTQSIQPSEQPKDTTFHPTDPNMSAEIPTLMFHYIEDVPANTEDQIRYNLSFSPKRLELMLQYFQEHNVTPITYWDIKDIAEGKKEMPEKPVILTFDDGHLDHYTEAFPLLEKYNMRGVFFIVADKPDKDPNYATWAHIQEMAEHGHEIGSHTMTHRDLTLLTAEDLSYEVGESKNIIEEKINMPVISLCYPSGKYNEQVIAETKKSYLFARTTEAGTTFSLQEPYQLPVRRIFPTHGMNALKIWFP